MGGGGQGGDDPQEAFLASLITPGWALLVSWASSLAHPRNVKCRGWQCQYCSLTPWGHTQTPAFPKAS